MDISEFRKAHAEKLLGKKGHFDWDPPDPPASEAQIENLERALGASLPVDYREFLKEYGGGSFGFTNISSAQPGSEYYLLDGIDHSRDIAGKDFIPITDDFCGGWYGFREIDGAIGSAIFYWNQDGGMQGVIYENVFELLNDQAYE